MEKVTILNQEQIHQKLKRIAFEIWEHSGNEKEIVLVGIANAGSVIARNLRQILQDISPLSIQVHQLTINKKNPLKSPVEIQPAIDLDKKTVFLIDDVANSGKTLLYGLKPILEQLPSRIKVVVLVDRKHKNFPITPDITGHSVSTTLQDKIVVSYEGDTLTHAYLE